MELFRHAKTFEDYPKGTLIVREGEKGDRMYVVQHGEVEIVHDGEVLERVGPGGFFGEMVLIDDLPRGATGRAATAVRMASRANGSSFRASTGASRQSGRVTSTPASTRVCRSSRIGCSYSAPSTRRGT